MSKLIDDFKNYHDRYGMISLDKDMGTGTGTQNGSLFTFEYIINLLEDPNTTQNEKDEEIYRLRKVFLSLETSPGVTSRNPVDTTFNESMDNMLTNLAFSALFDNGNLARRIKNHGENIEASGMHSKYEEINSKYYALASLFTAFQIATKPRLWWSFIRNKFRPKFFWNNVSPLEFNGRSWFGRSPGFMGIIDISATRRTTPFRWFALFIGQFIGCFADIGDTNARKLPYVGWYLMTKKPEGIMKWICVQSYKIWVKILLKQYPNGMKDVFGIYYSNKHPINQHSVEYFKC